MSKIMASWMIAAMLLVPSTLCADQDPLPEATSISFGPIRVVTEKDEFDNPKELKEFTVTVEAPTEEGEPQRFVVQGPDDFVNLEEQPRGKIVDSRLLVTTRALIAVFDLETGDQVLHVVAAPQVAVTDDGRRVAFETLQRRFTPPEASSSVIQVLDVPTLQVEPVFPQRSAISPSQFGQLLAWVDDPSNRHSAGKLFFSPDGSRLVFFCTHGGNQPDVRQKVYLVVVDLSQGLDESCFIHRPFDWQEHLRPEIKLGDRRPYFDAESLEWRDDDTLVVRPPHRARWLEDQIVVPLPEPDDCSSGANSVDG